MVQRSDFSVDEVFPKLEVHRYEDTAALYVNGQLDRTGEEYVIVERVFELLGVKLVTDNAFIRGDADTFASSLDEVARYRAVRDDGRREAHDMRVKAAELVRQAELLEARYGRSSYVP